MDAIDAAMGDNGLAHMRMVGNKLTRAIPGFAAKTYGYRTITDLVSALPVHRTDQAGQRDLRPRK